MKMTKNALGRPYFITKLITYCLTKRERGNKKLQQGMFASPLY